VNDEGEKKQVKDQKCGCGGDVDETEAYDQA
jgi:hypothetical protein